MNQLTDYKNNNYLFRCLIRFYRWLHLITDRTRY